MVVQVGCMNLKGVQACTHEKTSKFEALKELDQNIKTALIMTANFRHDTFRISHKTYKALCIFKGILT